MVDALKLGLLALALVLLAACEQMPVKEGAGQEPAPEQKAKAKAVPTPDKDFAPENPPDLSQVGNAVPVDEPRSKYGNPDSYEVLDVKYKVLESANGYKEKGLASWYGMKFHGKRTSSGEPYDLYKMTAAHKTLPIPCYAKVTNLENGKWVIVKVNDRGPFHENRLMDLSYVAAHKLGVLGRGTSLVEVEVVKPEGNKDPKVSHGQDKQLKPFTKVWVQVGAFSQKANAEKLQAKLAASLKRDVRVVESSGFFKVSIGPLQKVEQVDELTKKLDTLGIEKTHMVTE